MHLVETGMLRSTSFRDMSQVQLLVLSTFLLAWSGNQTYRFESRTDTHKSLPSPLYFHEFYSRRGLINPNRLIPQLLIPVYAYPEGTLLNDNARASIVETVLEREPATFKLYTRCV